MGHQNMNLVLSTDTKPRLKWTPQLHQRFVEAVNQLGGADKATPKSLMRIMGISGPTLYHLKSRLQKYRLGKFQETEICHSNKLDDYKEIQSNNGNSSDGTHNQMNESLQIAQAFQMQMEVQRKLHKQIVVWPIKPIPIYIADIKLIQQCITTGSETSAAKIEAQGKYLQLVLKKAQETLVGIDQNRRFKLKRDRSPIRGTMSSMESSLSASESCRRKDVEPPQDENICTRKSNTSAELSLMEVHTEKKPLISGSSNQANGKKRSGSDFSDGILVEQPLAKRLEFPGEETGYRLRKSGLLRSFDLNSQCHNDTESASKAVDLNCRE
ncbi:hypothetical protein CXB51_004362 [Gossypium anomalum]|uniref:Myb-like domain-containing protein n=1 Tax=Gossypium anomalum TaxID=47600 RepID=A0A8J5ZJC6_9ROSI|nr:hypothetical protein CXB51_004362 [Gossypium anomalum]